jgi:hypothetical protein
MPKAHIEPRGGKSVAVNNGPAVRRAKLGITELPPVAQLQLFALRRVIRDL